MNEDNYIRLAATRASSLLGVPRGELITGVVSAKFPWLHEGEIVWSRTPDFRHCMFWIVDGEEPLLLNGKDWTSAVSKVLVASVGSLPDDLSAASLAQAIRQLGHDPRGLLAGKELVERVGDSLENWLKKDDAHDRQLFLDANKDTVLRAEGEHGWELEFNYFNVKGGVEAYRVTGDHAAIQSADRTELLPDHTFFWPMA
ncbi:MAG: hypothetical protein ACMG6S_33735 [Byssovorax sp.]